MAIVEWKFTLVNSSNLSAIGELSEARDKALSVGLNKPGSASFTYPFSGGLASEIEVVSTGIIAYRRGSDGVFKNVWSGYVNEIEENVDEETMSISCVGWFERLNNRIAKQEVMWTTQYDHDIILGKSDGTPMTTPTGTSFTCPSGIIQIANLTEINPGGQQVITETVASGSTIKPLLAPGEKVSSGDPVVTITTSGNVSTNKTSSINGFVVSVNGTKNTPSAPFTASGTFNLATIAPYYSIPSGAFPSGVGAYPLPLMSGASTLTLMSGGTYESTTTITPSAAAVQKSFKIEQDQSFGEAIISLTEQENGPDIEVDPQTRKLNVYRKKGTKKENVYFSYNWGPSNLKNFTKRTTTDKLANNLIGRANGVAPVMLATASGSFSKYGLFEDVLNLNQNAPNPNVLSYYTAAEYVFTSVPEVTYSITPFPYTIGSSVPEPFIDYEIGDQVYIRARKEPRIDDSQLVRIFGINISIDSEGNEFVNDLQIYYQ
jgi:hypothetical protein